MNKLNYYRSDIEGIRAIAILFVVGYHGKIPGLSGGYIGVDVFFVLSGYLITSILVRELVETGTIDILEFYSRRARRLLPASAAMLLMTILLSSVVYAPFEQRIIANSATSAATYLSNIYFAKTATDYFGALLETNPFLHTWSLSVEEQFYFAWPVFLLFIFRASKYTPKSKELTFIYLFSLIIGLVGLSFALSLYLTFRRQQMAFFLAPSRAWEFAIGAMGVLLNNQEMFRVPLFGNVISRSWLLFTRNIRVNNAIGCLSFCGILFSALIFDRKMSFPGFAAIIPAISTLFLILSSSAQPDSLISKLLSLRCFSIVGRLSYSWYLWHWPVLVIAASVNNNLTLASRLALLGSSFIISVVSFLYIENPIRYSRHLVNNKYYSIILAAFFTIFGVAVSLSWRQASIKWARTSGQIKYTKTWQELPLIYSMNCDEYFSSAEVKQCIFGSSKSVKTAVLFGDSFAGQWYPAIASTFASGEWHLVVITKSSCPIVDRSFFDRNIGRTYYECDQWRNDALNKIHEIKPDLVILSSNDTYYPFTYNDWKVGVDKVYNSLSISSKQVILLRATPQPGFDVPTCLARLGWRPATLPGIPCSVDRNNKQADDIFSILTEAARKYSNIHLIDMNKIICPDINCQMEQKGLVVFRDRKHLASKYANSLAQELASQIEAVTK